MSNKQDIIQVPANYIVQCYNAVKKVTKWPAITSGIDIVPEAGITYSYDVETGVARYFSAPQWDASGKLTQDVVISFKVQTFKDLYDAGLPLTISLPDYDYGVTTHLHLHNVDIIIDPQDITSTPAVLTIKNSSFLTSSASNFIDLYLTFTRDAVVTYNFKVDKPFYPFPYETKHIGLGDAVEYIAPTNPTWIDIDINSMFMTPRTIPCSVGEKLYVLHKNKS